jgi:hypothetical protein
MREPVQAEYAFMYLSTTPCQYIAGTVHPLRYPFKPYWQFEAVYHETLYYTTTENIGGFGMTILLGVRNDIFTFTAPRLAKMFDARRPAAEMTFDNALAELQLFIDEPLRVPEWAFGNWRGGRAV